MHKSGKGHSRSLRIISKPAGFSWQASRAVSYNIPYFYRFTTGIYYTTDPFIHLFSEDILFLFRSFLDDGIISFPVEVDIIDVSMPLTRA